MKSIKIIPIQTAPYEGERGELSLAIGNFDGVHRGHQAVIREAVRFARQEGISSGVVTFHPHPRTIVLGEEAPVLTPLPDKIELIEELGVDRLYLIHFNKEFSTLSPSSFIQNILLPLGVRHIAVGFDFRFGHKGEGTANFLRDAGKDRFSVSIVAPVLDGAEKISSSLIRSLILEGKVEEVIPYLNHPHSIRGEVVHGEKRGRLLGFPTANLHCREQYLLPASGVYGVKVKHGERFYSGVMNIGVKPTFQGEAKTTAEVHLLDMEGNLYGEELKVFFLFRIREERRFPSLEALKDQIASDIQFARERLL
ncbi:Riboflavin biosynthesis protein RibC (Includes: Riboflavin kinase; FMN adenylyltransferase) [[Clostridium] ultunense Esp]|nr:Riboflavin biosynthesis protein RibC (Includes: Riboflavin kinase; FMN adenylyltransferase) [[Clostridium] ultunense Esp]